MESFEKDMEYANKILRIRSAMEDGSIVEKDGIHSFSMNSSVFEYHMEFCGEAVVIGYLERRIQTSEIWVSWDAIYYDYRTTHIRYPVNPTNPSEMIKIDDDVIDEAWYFQNSLVYNPDVLRAVMVVKTLHSVESKYEYFQLKTRHIDNIIQRL